MTLTDKDIVPCSECGEFELLETILTVEASGIRSRVTCPMCTKSGPNSSVFEDIETARSKAIELWNQSQ